jgi:hypothetical protein
VEGFDGVESVEAVDAAEKEPWRGSLEGDVGERYDFSSSLICAGLRASSESESESFHGFPETTSWGIELTCNVRLCGVAGLTSSSGIGSDFDDTGLYTLGGGMYPGSGADDANDGILERAGREWNSSPILLTNHEDLLLGRGFVAGYSLDDPGMSVGETEVASVRTRPVE